jgi:uncharacterized protein (DUF1501 family)
MSKSIDRSRREFLKRASLLPVASSFGTSLALNLFGMNRAVAAPVYTNYKALVCLYLAGGNDSANMVIATDTPSWIGYQAARGGSIAIPQADLLPIVPATTKVDAVGTRAFALHPGMAPLQTLFNGGRAAIVANVGTLIDPIADKTAYQLSTTVKPKNLFSHSDQTAQWQTADPANLLSGWGGRMSDLLIASNTQPNFTNISLSGNCIFLAGNTVHQYQVNSNGSAVEIRGLSNLFGAATNPLQDIITNTGASNLLESEHAAVVQRAIDAQATLNNALAATPASSLLAPTPYTTYYGGQATNPIATQLQTVARIIACQNDLGVKRQVFFINVGGFDTHNGQLPNHGNLMARLAHAMEYFDSALTSLPNGIGDMSANVTLFTASDFGRTLASNGSGTDHGWGGHHIVSGGAVNGGDIYGTFPPTSVGSSNPLDVGSGRMIPTITVDQYAATLAKWFGLDPLAGDITAAFPSLGTLPPDLGFMTPP